MPTEYQNTVGSAEEAEKSSAMSHLLELRRRLLYSVAAVLGIFCVLYPFSGRLYSLLAVPMLSQLPESGGLIATGIAAPFLAPLTLTFAVACFICVPFLLHQLWSFITPALYQHEKRWMGPILISSVVLFYSGVAFAYTVVFPLVFGFFTHIAPEGVRVTPEISAYLSFCLQLFFAFGFAFEVPIATFLCIKAGITTAEQLAKKRPYIIVGAFVLGMFLTPPDVLSQILLALPLWLLFELGLFFSKITQQ